MESVAASKPLEHVREIIAATPEEHMDAPEAALVATAILHADVGPEKRDALQSWLLQGTVDELSDDMQQALQRLQQQFGGHGGREEKQ